MNSSSRRKESAGKKSNACMEAGCRPTVRKGLHAEGEGSERQGMEGMKEASEQQGCRGGEGEREREDEGRRRSNMAIRVDTSIRRQRDDDSEERE